MHTCRAVSTTFRTGIGPDTPQVDQPMTYSCSCDNGGGTLSLQPSSPLHRLRLPRLKCPSSSVGSPQRSSIVTSPPTPRRRHGRLAAGAALAYFSPCRRFSLYHPSFSPLMSPNHQYSHASKIEATASPSGLSGNQGGNGGGKNNGRDPSLEASQNVNDELLLFFFQLDLNTRLQKALNQDQYEPAQALREKIAQVEQEVAAQRNARLGESFRGEAQDKEISMLNLRGQLQKAIEEERYADAAKIRDQLSKMESENLAAAASSLAANFASYEFRLGQKVVHKVFGYRGVICGMDPHCRENDTWQETSGVSALTRGSAQPFYQVLVDMRESLTFAVAYVAEDNLKLPEEPDLEQFEHPYMYLLFYGMDSNGDMIATRQLREKYSAPRHEVPSAEEADPGQGSSDTS